MEKEKETSCKRVAFVHEDFPSGGAERCTFDLARYLDEHGYKVYVFAYRHRVECYPEQLPVRFTVLRFPEPSVYKSDRNARFLGEQVKALRLDVLVSVVNPLQHVDKILPRGAHCKYVMANHSLPFWEVMAKEYDKKRRLTQTVWGFIWWWAVQYPRARWFNVYGRRYARRYRETYDRADAYVVLCEEYKQDLCRCFNIDAVDCKIVAIPNSEREVPAEIRSAPKKKQVLYVGRMSYADKRVDRLLRIWSRIEREVPGWELVLVGDGDERSALEALAASLHVERVRFEGASTNVRHYYREAAVLCLTSSFEGWGLVLTEAQAHGVVPIAFDCCAGVHHILAPSGTNGVLVPPFDERAYGRELLRLMQDAPLRAALQRNVVRKVGDYDVEKVGRKWLDLFERLG